MHYFPILETKIEATTLRFEYLLEFTTTGRGNASADEREMVYNNFYNNLDDFILFGKKGYLPYPHNQFMEIIMRWGIIFGAPLLIFNVRNIFKGLKLIVKNVAVKPFYKLFVFCL